VSVIVEMQSGGDNDDDAVLLAFFAGNAGGKTQELIQRIGATNARQLIIDQGATYVEVKYASANGSGNINSKITAFHLG